MSVMIAVALAFAAGAGEGEPVGLGATRALDVAWYGALARLSERDLGAADAHLERLVTLQRGLQMPNLFVLSDTLLLRAAELRHAGYPEAANRLTRHAARLAPENPAVPLERYHTLTGSGGGLDARIEALSEAAALQWGHLGHRMLMSGRLAIVGLLAILGAVVLAGALMLIRHGRRLRHDAEHLLPAAARGVPMVVLLLVALVVAPLAVGAGLVPMSLGWCVVLGLYLSWRERLVVAGLALAVAATPWLHARYAAALAYPGSVEEALYDCYYGRCARLARVQEAASRRSFDPLAKAALGVRAKRLAAGDPEAVQGLHDATLHLEVAAEAAPGDYVIEVNRLNAAYTRAQRTCERGAPDLAGARDGYVRAMALVDGPAEAALGRGVALYQSGDAAAGAAARAEASVIGGDRIDDLVEAAGEPPRQACVPAFDGNLHLADALPPVERLEARLHTAVEGGAVLAPFGVLLVGLAGAGVIGWLGLVAALLLLATGALRQVFRPAWTCTTCGRVACGRCRRELRGLDICEQCLHLRIQGGLVDSRDRWLRERDRHAGLARRQGFVRGFSVVLPGSGLLLTGRPVVGGSTLLLFLAGALMAAASDTLLPHVGVVGAPGPVLVVLDGLVAFLAWALSLALVVRRSL